MSYSCEYDKSFPGVRFTGSTMPYSGLSVTVDSVCKYQHLGMTNQYVQGQETSFLLQGVYNLTLLTYIDLLPRLDNSSLCDIYNNMLNFGVPVCWYHFTRVLTTHLTPTFLYVHPCVCSFFIPSCHVKSKAFHVKTPRVES